MDEARAEELVNGHNARNEKLIVEVLVKEEPKQEATENEVEDPDKDKVEDKFPKLIGGGYYELSNGEKVQGKDKAEEAEKALEK